MIDLERARELLKRAVETQGRDFVYNPGGFGHCYYSVDAIHHNEDIAPDSPKRKTGCLIGVALSLANITLPQDDNDSISYIHSRYQDMMTYKAMRYFQVAQTVQDNGESWGAAYDRAENFMSKLKTAKGE